MDIERVKHNCELFNNPLISVITVVYNGAKTLEQTILSVINQTYQNIEYIIIDGGSTDGTLDIITNYELQIKNGEFPNVSFRYVSEPDSGIYDAMNKGIDMATGGWINFMNAGDWFYDAHVIKNIYSLPVEGDIIYGATELRFDWGNYIQKTLKKTHPWNKRIGHQSVFCKSSLLKKMKFNTNYTICADYEFMLKCFLNNCYFKCYDMIVSSYDTHGVSNGVLTSKERVLILFHNKWYLLSHILLIIKIIYGFIKYQLSIFVSHFFPLLMQQYRNQKYKQ
jgi:glycosyltransferase involved in cell wall biosynthesis